MEYLDVNQTDWSALYDLRIGLVNETVGLGNEIFLGDLAPLQFLVLHLRGFEVSQAD